MSTESWDWRLPTDYQDYPWDCSACSTAWATRTVGYLYSEQDIIAALGPSRITPTYGLMDASGAGLAACLNELGIAANSTGSVSWSALINECGLAPTVIGGRAWYHWVAVRMSSVVAGVGGAPTLLLMNPAPGWMGVDQLLTESDYNALGPWSAVRLTDYL